MSETNDPSTVSLKEKDLTYNNTKSAFCNADQQGKVTEVIFLQHFLMNEGARDSGQIGRDEYQKNLNRMHKANYSKLDDKAEKKRVEKAAEVAELKLKRLRVMDQVQEMTEKPEVLNKIDFLAPLMTTTMNLVENHEMNPKEGKAILKQVSANKAIITDPYCEKLFNSHYPTYSDRLHKLKLDN